LWRAITVVLLSLCAHSQTAHYSVLCDLLRESQKPTDLGTVSTFRIEVPHRVISNITAAVAQGPRRIMILRDISASIGGKNAQAVSFEAIKDLAEISQPSDQLLLVDFSDKSQVVIDFEEHAAFSKQLDNLKQSSLPKPKGHTALFDTIDTAASYLEKTPHEGDTILAITDGVDNRSKIGMEKLKGQLLAARIRVYWLALTDSYGRTPEEESSQSDLIGLLNATGGQTMRVVPTGFPDMTHGPDYDASPTSLAFLRKQVEFLYGAMTKPLRIEFDADAPITKSTKLTVTAFGKDGKRTAGFQTVCPSHINPN